MDKKRKGASTGKLGFLQGVFGGTGADEHPEAKIDEMLSVVPDEFLVHWLETRSHAAANRRAAIALIYNHFRNEVKSILAEWSSIEGKFFSSSKATPTSPAKAPQIVAPKADSELTGTIADEPADKSTRNAPDKDTDEASGKVADKAPGNAQVEARGEAPGAAPSKARNNQVDNPLAPTPPKVSRHSRKGGRPMHAESLATPAGLEPGFIESSEIYHIDDGEVHEIDLVRPEHGSDYRTRSTDEARPEAPGEAPEQAPVALPEHMTHEMTYAAADKTTVESEAEFLENSQGELKGEAAGKSDADFSGRVTKNLAEGSKAALQGAGREDIAVDLSVGFAEASKGDPSVKDRGDIADESPVDGEDQPMDNFHKKAPLGATQSEGAVEHLIQNNPGNLDLTPKPEVYAIEIILPSKGTCKLLVRPRQVTIDLTPLREWQPPEGGGRFLANRGQWWAELDNNTREQLGMEKRSFFLYEEIREVFEDMRQATGLRKFALANLSLEYLMFLLAEDWPLPELYFKRRLPKAGLAGLLGFSAPRMIYKEERIWPQLTPAAIDFIELIRRQFKEEQSYILNAGINALAATVYGPVDLWRRGG